MDQSATPPEQETPYSQASSRYYMLGVLTLIYAVNFIDRQLLAILQEPIKAELGLSDGQLGLLTGFAFAVFYVTAGIPIASLADKANRRNIIANVVALWSVMTAACGLAQNYWQLLAARIGVGVGEAGCSPPAHSMLSDVFPPSFRATALSIYSSGINVGILFGFLLGGWLNEFFGWRVAFIVVGLPGVLIALLVKFSIAEPIRGFSEDRQAAAKAKPSKLNDVLKLIWSRPSLRHLMFAGSLSAFSGYSVTSWIASYILRNYEMGTGELGTWLALTIGVFGAIGTLCSGVIADRLGRRDQRWYMWLPAIASLLAAPFFALTMMASSAQATLLINIVPMMLSTVYVGSCVAMIHGMLNINMRATGSAVFYFILNIIGLGLGPYSVGLLSDYLQIDYGVDGLRYAMMILICSAWLWSTVHYYWASKTLKQDLARVPD
ncbi:spinster family MFS transporter [Oceanicoccus sagamiensis]|uniref:MFS transporter n=1 Tax=Oceanicoccus sagamiensis TaxID=716816 RepID=A0A1X9NDL5_9GAMM|nr:MFS transporter [Oceanicoccus sagamiensis]ARN75656.1 MFS transporter [Oceanicoccus sagamiensis]